MLTIIAKCGRVSNVMARRASDYLLRRLQGSKYLEDESGDFFLKLEILIPS